MIPFEQCDPSGGPGSGRCFVCKLWRSITFPLFDRVQPSVETGSRFVGVGEAEGERGAQCCGSSRIRLREGQAQGECPPMPWSLAGWVEGGGEVGWGEREV